MHSIMSGCVLLAVLMMVHMSSAAFSWSDCGVQLNKDIHYQSASISPSTAVAGKTFALNVQATISDRIENDAKTRLIVWKDGNIFLDVYIDKLCSIISNTKAMKCPLDVGLVSFTYEFESVPTLVSGDYIIQVKHYDLNPLLTEQSEIGCIQFQGTVQGAQGNVKTDKCAYESTFYAQLVGDAKYTTTVRTDRKEGDLIQIGPIGKLSTAAGASFGTFDGEFMATDDIGGNQESTGYMWALNGTLIQHNDTNNIIVDNYSGTFYVLYKNVTYFQGYFDWTSTYQDQKEVITGTMWLSPEYYYGRPQFTWPVIVGNLGPFKVQTVDSGHIVVKGSHTFCTCGVDACGVCNGKGNTCGLGAPDNGGDDWGVRKKAAVACGCVAVVLLAVVIELARRVRKEKRRIPIDDQDLLDHPEKPDYGTMAIDDAIREGERIV